jgi:hypothetical protein
VFNTRNDPPTPAQTSKTMKIINQKQSVYITFQFHYPHRPAGENILSTSIYTDWSV